jgi:hypothetical protein
VAELLCFETCPRCSQFFQIDDCKLKPMTLSGDDKSMQCSVCDKTFKLPDSESVREMARRQREARYDS